MYFFYQSQNKHSTRLYAALVVGVRVSHNAGIFYTSAFNTNKFFYYNIIAEGTTCGPPPHTFADIYVKVKNE